jgi:hypothetical protein
MTGTVTINASQPSTTEMFADRPAQLTNIVDCDLDKIRIGLAVRLVFTPSESG